MGVRSVEPRAAISRVQRQFSRVLQGHSDHQTLELLHLDQLDR